MNQVQDCRGEPTTREKLALVRERREARAKRAAVLREIRRQAIVESRAIPDDTSHQESSACERDIEDLDAAIATLEQKIAEEEASERRAAETTAAAAEAQRQEERRKSRARSGAKLDKAFAQVEAAYRAYLAEHHDAPEAAKRRQTFNLLAALHAAAPQFALALDARRIPHHHQRPLSEVSL